MKKLLSLSLICILLPLFASAAYTSNGFYIVTKSLNFDKTIRSGKCHGKIPYPQVSNYDEELFMKINDKIHDFVEIYAICNQGKRDNFSVTYDVPESGTKDFFSVRFLTKKDGKLWRIDTLNFNAETGDFVKIDDVFNMLSNHMMGHMVKLSEGHLSSKDTWEHFIEKIEKRDIQFYIKNREWYLAFNASTALNKVVNVKIPEYFLIGTRDHDRG